MSKQLNTAIRAAEAAGKILMQNFGKGTTAKRKSKKEFVTPIDLKCEKKILSILQKDFSDYDVWSEEMGSQDNKSEDYRWIVDPLDGTHNFFYGIPIFGVSIALEKRGKIQCGVIFLPYFKELFTAERGRGAFLNGKRIRVSNRKVGDSIVSFCTHFLDKKGILNKFAMVNSRVFSIRSFGSTAFTLSSIAAGRIDAVIEFFDKPGDFAAGWLLVEEAGGKFTRSDGRKFSVKYSDYIASSGIFHSELVKIIGGKK